jgi:hypothetical protein
MLMKTSSDTGPRPKSKRATGLNCLLINQLATPGLGSLMGGRILAGSIQLGLALLGFCLVLAWVIRLSANAYRQAFQLPTQPDAHPWMGMAGFAVFAASWCLSWVTSLSLIQHDRREKEKTAETKPVPPLIRP